MKSLGLAICLACLLAGLIACDPNEPGPTFSNTPGVADWENLPLYPDAQNVIRTTTNTPAVQNVVFATTSDLSQVLDFYQTNLRQRGWITLAELLNRPVPATRYNTSEERLFFWIDRTGVTPWRSEFTIEFAGVNVYLHIERWPDPKQVPIYPGSSAQETHDTLIQGRFTVHVTTYLAPVSPTDVLSYYQQLMPIYGWRLSADQVGSMSLNYGYEYGGGEWVLASLGELITATADPGGTRVELQAMGTELPVGSPVAVPPTAAVLSTPTVGY